MFVYLSGPMRGYKKFNFPLFDAVTAKLEKVGMRVANPAAHDRQAYPDIERWEGFESGDTTKCPKFILPDSLRWDFSQILQCNAIVLLPGWENSSGAKAERFVAECVGKAVFLYLPYDDGRDGFGLILDPRQQMEYPKIKNITPDSAIVVRYDEPVTAFTPEQPIIPEPFVQDRKDDVELRKDEPL